MPSWLMGGSAGEAGSGGAPKFPRLATVLFEQSRIKCASRGSRRRSRRRCLARNNGLIVRDSAPEPFFSQPRAQRSKRGTPVDVNQLSSDSAAKLRSAKERAVVLVKSRSTAVRSEGAKLEGQRSAAVLGWSSHPCRGGGRPRPSRVAGVTSSRTGSRQSRGGCSKCRASARKARPPRPSPSEAWARPR
jgi:hypothetical protein